MDILVIAREKTLASDIRRMFSSRGLAITEACSPDEAVEYLADKSKFELVVVSMATVWGGSRKWDVIISACGKRQACVFVPDTCEITAISGIILNNQVVCPIDTAAGKKVFSMIVSGIIEYRQRIDAYRNAAKQRRANSTKEQISDNGVKSSSPYFTKRQKQVLDLMVIGKSNREIASELNVAEGTVKLHSLSIYRSLGVSNRVQAVLRGQQLINGGYVV